MTEAGERPGRTDGSGGSECSDGAALLGAPGGPGGPRGSGGFRCSGAGTGQGRPELPAASQLLVMAEAEGAAAVETSPPPGNVPAGSAPAGNTPSGEEPAVVDELAAPESGPSSAASEPPGSGRTEPGGAPPSGTSGDGLAWNDGLIARRAPGNGALRSSRPFDIERARPPEAAAGPGASGRAPERRPGTATTVSHPAASHPAASHPAGFSRALRTRLEALRELVGLSAARLDARTLAEAGHVLDEAVARHRLSLGHTVVALAGAGGSGKSSLFNALVGAQVSAAGVRRPTTTETLACTWSEGADGLLDRLGIPPALRRRAPRDPARQWPGLAPGPFRHRRGAPATAPDLSGLVLLDLPDHDSSVPGHRREVDRLLGLVDAVVWVVDPEKYADAVLHERYLRPLAGYDEVTFVVLNQVDRLPGEAAEQVLDDLRRVLDEDGLALAEHGEPGATVLAVSALTGEGLDELREQLARFVATGAAAERRLAADVDGAARRLAPVCRTEGRTGLSARARAEFEDRLAASIGAVAAGEAAEREWLRLAARRCGTPWSQVRGRREARRGGGGSGARGVTEAEETAAEQTEDRAAGPAGVRGAAALPQAREVPGGRDVAGAPTASGAGAAPAASPEGWAAKVMRAARAGKAVKAAGAARAPRNASTAERVEAAETAGSGQAGQAVQAGEAARATRAAGAGEAREFGEAGEAGEAEQAVRAGRGGRDEQHRRGVPGERGAEAAAARTAEGAGRAAVPSRVGEGPGAAEPVGGPAAGDPAVGGPASGDTPDAPDRSGPGPEPRAARAVVEQAVRVVAAEAAGGLPGPWAHAVLESAVGGARELSEALDSAAARVAATGAPVAPRWWTFVSLLQWLLLAVQLAAGAWLVTTATGGVPGGWAPPALVLGGSAVAGPLLARACRFAARGPARARGRRTERWLRDAAAACGRSRILEPVAAEALRYREARVQHAVTAGGAAHL
ncbi:GTPase [Streptomyces zingiberis]|uniref:GTPase n=1 Tax=Streptomyces zingiberis TaxID=2053010 RepID=UPI002892F6B5|nr:GTPase [Streptomyces zingiberis]